MLNVPTVYEPVFQVMPKDHHFGTVPVGGCATTNITITDYDGRDLHIFDIRLGGSTDPAFSFPNLPIFPVLVPSESSTTVEIMFCPTRQGYLCGSVEISSDDPVQPWTCVTLHGLGLAPA